MKPASKNMKITRRQRREWAIQILASVDLNPPDDLDACLEDFWNAMSTVDPEEGGVDLPARNRAFTEERVRGVLENRVEIDRRLDALLDNWDLDRLGTIERAVLRMGAWEMLWTDTPPPVVINEAIDLSNWFAGPKSRSLVNGVLDKLAKSGEAGSKAAASSK